MVFQWFKTYDIILCLYCVLLNCKSFFNKILEKLRRFIYFPDEMELILYKYDNILKYFNFRTGITLLGCLPIGKYFIGLKHV